MNRTADAPYGEMDGYLSKPVRREDLFRQIGQMCSGRIGAVGVIRNEPMVKSRV